MKKPRRRFHGGEGAAAQWCGSKQACPANLPPLTKAGMDNRAHRKSAHRFHINATTLPESCYFCTCMSPGNNLGGRNTIIG